MMVGVGKLDLEKVQLKAIKLKSTGTMVVIEVMILNAECAIIFLILFAEPMELVIRIYVN